MKDQVGISRGGKKCLDSGYVLKAGLTGFMNRLKVVYARKESRMTPRILTEATGRTELLFARIQKALGGAVLGLGSSRMWLWTY